MYQQVYEEMVRFASEGALGDELKQARQEFVQRTGEMFETDESFERRISGFLEWYVLDRPVSNGPSTPAKLFIDVKAPALSPAELARISDLTRTKLSLFEFKRVKDEHIEVIDLLTDERHRIFERRRPAGLESGDILEARLVPWEEKLLFSESYGFHPRRARKRILAVTKQFRKNGGGESRLDLVHRVAFLTNRCSRYRHVDPRQIFAEL